MRSDTLELDSVLDPKTPLVTARLILAQYRTADGDETIRLWDDRFFCWAKGVWQEIEIEAVRRLVYRFCETKMVVTKRGENENIEPYSPTKAKVDGIIDAMRAECYLAQRFVSPCWLDAHENRPSPTDLLVCKNGLVHLPTFVGGGDYLTAHTPLFWNFNGLDYDFAPMAPLPTEWLNFLNTLWPDDAESTALLQQWFGYCLTSNTSLQKMLLMYGPKRSGKGTIAFVLTLLLGVFNVAGPTLGSLTTNFGLWPLVGKSLAIIGDARLSGRTDQSIVVERLLSISGEDLQTIDRKNQTPITLRLKARIMILTNELPKIADSSGALASRFLILRLTRGFLGQEDLGLKEKLAAELPAILLWAIEGWHRLREQGRFTIPASSAEAVRELDDLGSPISAFVRETCTVGTGKAVAVDEIYQAWVTWCAQQGRDHPGTKPSFGRDLGAAYPGIRVTQPRIGGVRYRQYEGIGLEVGGGM